MILIIFILNKYINKRLEREDLKLLFSYRYCLNMFKAIVNKKRVLFVTTQFAFALKTIFQHKN